MAERGLPAVPGSPPVAEMEARQDVAGLLRTISEQPFTRAGQEAAAALGRLKPPGAVESLTAKWLFAGSPPVRAQAARALGKIADAAAIPHLLRALDDKVTNVRAEVARALGLIGDRSAAPALIRLLKDADVYVRQQAAEALGRLGDPAAIGPLIEALGSADAAVRSKAAWALTQFGEPAVEPLLQATVDDDADLRWRAAEVLDRLGNRDALLSMLKHPDPAIRVRTIQALSRAEDAEAIGLLAQMLGDEVGVVRRLAAEALAGFGEPAVRVLLEAMDDAAAVQKRQAAAEALGLMKSERAAGRLVALVLRDVEPGVRAAAAEALGRIGVKGAMTVLEQAARGGPVEVRAAAVMALGRIGSGAAFAHLAAALRDESPAVRSAACAALGLLKDPRITDHLLRGLTDAEPAVREAAAHSLGRLGDPAAIGGLTAAVEDPDVHVSRAARKALFAIRERVARGRE